MVPAITKFTSDRSGFKECDKKCNELSLLVEELKEECREVNEKYKEVNDKYFMLLGSMSVIKTKLQGLGFDDITTLTKSNEQGI